MSEQPSTENAPTKLFVLMGVSGSGKTTIGQLLAKRLDVPFLDADDYHSAANKAKMHAGHPLTDEDRWPWLTTLNEQLCHYSHQGSGCVLACSALRVAYRQKLSAGLPNDSVRFVLLDGSRELIAQRLAMRHHEYMNSSLLDSQLATLESPADALRITNDRTPDAVVDEILECEHLA